MIFKVSVNNSTFWLVKRQIAAITEEAVAESKSGKKHRNEGKLQRNAQKQGKILFFTHDLKNMLYNKLFFWNLVSKTFFHIF